LDVAGSASNRKRIHRALELRIVDLHTICLDLLSWRNDSYRGMHSGERVQSQSPAPEGAIGEAAVSADVPATASPAVAGQYPGRPPAARLGLHFEVWTSSTFRRSAPSGGVIAIFLVLLANVCLGQGSFSSPSNSNLAVRIQQLAADQRWPEIVRELESVPD
jgi:hypothetical protein